LRDELKSWLQFLGGQALYAVCFGYVVAYGALFEVFEPRKAGSLPPIDWARMLASTVCFTLVWFAVVSTIRVIYRSR
jgi:hypothetical protein